MTVGAQCYEIIQVIISKCTAKLDVVNFELSRPSALLTSPAIPFKRASAQESVIPWAQLDSRAPLPERSHAHCRMLSRSSRFPLTGRNS